MWLNVSKDKTYHFPHTHSNNNFAGVWYPFDQHSPLIFIDPRIQKNVWVPRLKNNSHLTASQVAFTNKKNMGLIFPAWLQHYVPPANVSRTSISWNVLIRGEYGEQNTLQNSNNTNGKKKGNTKG